MVDYLSYDLERAHSGRVMLLSDGHSALVANIFLSGSLRRQEELQIVEFVDDPPVLFTAFQTSGSIIWDLVSVYRKFP